MKKVAFIPLMAILLILPLSFLPIPESEAVLYIEDTNNWAYAPLQFRHVYFEDGFWSNQSSALAIIYLDKNDADIPKIAWYEINPDQPHTLKEPYSIISLYYGSLPSLAKYNDTCVLLAQKDGSANIKWRVVDDGGVISTSTFSTQVWNAVNGQSNIVKHYTNWYICIQDSDDLLFHGYPNGVRKDIYTDTDLEDGTVGNTLLLVSGSTGNSAYLMNTIILMAKSNIPSVIEGDYQSRVYKYDSVGDTFINVSPNLPIWVTASTSTRSFNFVSFGTADYGAGGDFAFVTQHLTVSGKHSLNCFQVPVNSGNPSGVDTVTFAGGIGTGYTPCGWLDTWMSRVIGDQDVGEELSELIISSYGYGTGGPFITGGLNDGALGEVYSTPNFLFGYQYDTNYRIEINTSYRLETYTYLGEAPPPDSDIRETENVIGNDQPTNNTKTMVVGTHYFIENIETSKSSYVKEVGFYFNGNATNVVDYDVGLGVYVASNQQPVSDSNPLMLVWQKSWHFTGGDAFAYNLTAYPFLNLPPQSRVAVAYASTCALDVNRSLTYETMYNDSRIMPSAITYLDFEGSQDVALYLVWAMLIIDPPAPAPEPEPSESNELYIIPRLQQLAWGLGLSMEIFGMILFMLCMLALVIIPKATFHIDSLPSPIYILGAVCLVWIFTGLSLTPIWFGVLCTLAVIGFSAFAFGKIAGGD